MSQEIRKFDAEVGKVLQLMIHSLYTNKDIFLRELISNASDACDKLRYESINNPAFATEDELKIEIIIEKQSGELVIRDNGIGMDKNDLIQNLGTIASSGTQKFLSNLQDKNSKEGLQLIGQFGVGFYSAFMVAKKVKVYSTKAGEDQTYVWESEGSGEYSISPSVEPKSRGTEIRLTIQDSDIEYLEKYKLQYIIKTYSDHISFPIYLVDENANSELVNSASALWTRSKGEISEEQYKEFYHHVAHAPDTPWVTLHNKAEGAVEYTNLLYIPSQKPFDLFHPDRKGRVKLYVKRVFITEDEPNLIPSYLRFLRGVIDSEDLPLNISRETFQHNQIITKIRKSIVKRVLSTLKTKAEQEKEEYKKFWLNFGEVMKEGLCEGALEEKEQLLEACRFYTTRSGENLISLDEYINNMLDGQEHIYFLTGISLEDLRKNPQLEGFAKRDIEVILLPDYVDDFWVNVINQYKNKELRSINTAGIDLDSIKKIEASQEEKTPDAEDSSAQANDEELVTYIKSVLTDRVKEVKISKKLVDSPSCLAIPEGAMNIRMEKYLIDQKQLSKKTAKILEINPNHPILINIKKLLGSEGNKAADLVEIIFNQACLIAGEAMDDPYAFTKKINELIAKAVSA
ncbi:heat shock protein 90 [endosymbiont of Acanthamoeba sp. UWC8]|uniref:molecular chaperone HtpG n=1 Tax=endosymbiont of Acanthamoeba sp. UWC8 TaxID=86106 RepID=UPI0004D135A3|nr:molecular chaperone HtpG [endosymbiont of Acanthamoeba sp. UWC8]AIF81689.1 heat shock protein 90 [endosymbiont of Acanthamoeba sp. UWC8]